MEDHKGSLFGSYKKPNILLTVNIPNHSPFDLWNLKIIVRSAHFLVGIFASFPTPIVIHVTKAFVWGSIIGPQDPWPFMLPTNLYPPPSLFLQPLPHGPSQGVLGRPPSLFISKVIDIFEAGH